MIYRIYTEDRNNEEYLAKIVLRRFEGFNVTKGTGYYKGNKEAFLCFEIDTLEDDNRLGIFRLAEEIKIQNNQECVLLQLDWERSILV